jgi:hypothetical protein
MKQISFLTTKLIFIIFFTFCSFLNGQNVKIKNVKIEPNFELGKKYKIEVFESKFQSNSKKDITLTNIEFVIQKDNNGLKECSWKYGEVNKIGVNLDENQKKIMNILYGIELRFALDKNGVIHEILNYEECKDNILKAYKTIPEIEKTGILESIKSSFESPERLTTILYPSLALYFKINGSILYTDSVNITNSFITSPFGGHDFPSFNTSKIDSINDNRVFISRTQSIKKEGLREFMIETFKDLSKQRNLTFDETKVPKNIDISIINSYDYNYVSKILSEVQMSKNIQIDNMKVEQIIKVNLKE